MLGDLADFRLESGIASSTEVLGNGLMLVGLEMTCSAGDTYIAKIEQSTDGDPLLIAIVRHVNRSRWRAQNTWQAYFTAGNYKWMQVTGVPQSFTGTVSSQPTGSWYLDFFAKPANWSTYSHPTVFPPTNRSSDSADAYAPSEQYTCQPDPMFFLVDFGPFGADTNTLIVTFSQYREDPLQVDVDNSTLIDTIPDDDALTDSEFAVLSPSISWKLWLLQVAL